MCSDSTNRDSALHAVLCAGSCSASESLSAVGTHCGSTLYTRSPPHDKGGSLSFPSDFEGVTGAFGFEVNSIRIGKKALSDTAHLGSPSQH